MSQAGETLTHKDLAREVGVSETTIKSYRRKFPTFIPVAGYGKPIRFKPEALAVCQAIHQAFGQGSSVLETERGLKERFPEYPENRAKAQRRGTDADMGAAMERFMATASQMMEGVAKLTQAQAASEQRLDRLESALAKLLDVEAENKARLGEFMERMAGKAQAEPAGEVRGESRGEGRIRAKKIVNVRSSEGRVDSYALEDEPAPEEPGIDQPGEALSQERETPADRGEPGGAGARDTPSGEFLALPVVIQSERGEYLGVPGKLHVEAFVGVLERMGRDTGAVLTSWVEQGEGWRFCLTRGDGSRLEHTFTPFITPRGNQVAEFTTLNVDGQDVDHQALTDYFRDVKAWL